MEPPSNQLDVDLLASVIAKTGDLISGVKLADASLPTPCADYDVRQLVGHVVSSAQFFAARVDGTDEEVDLEGYHAAFDAAADYALAGERLVKAFRSGAGERGVRLLSADEVPGTMLFDIVLNETIVHGWDIAAATSQQVPFSEEELLAGFPSLRRMLTPESRGDMFGAERVAPVGAPMLEQLIAFSGRDPEQPIGRRRTASSSFSVDSWDGDVWDEAEGATLAKARITKTFSGDIEGTSVAELLTVNTDVPAVYVAVERMSVSVSGAKGTFVLHHSAGTSPDGKPTVAWVIVPGSGTGELVGITGYGSISVREDGSHFLDLTYELPE